MANLQSLTASDLAVQVQEDRTLESNQDAGGNGGGLYDLFHPGSVDRAVVKSGFTVEEEMRFLAQIARAENWEDEGYTEPPDYRTRIAAMREYRQRAFDALALGGGVHRVTAHRSHTDEQGNAIEEDIEAVRMLQPNLSQTEKLLEEGLLEAKPLPGPSQALAPKDSEN